MITVIQKNQKTQMITITMSKFQMKRHIVVMNFSNPIIKCLNLEEMETHQVALDLNTFRVNKIYKTTIWECITYIITKSSLDTITRIPLKLNLIQNTTTQTVCWFFLHLKGSILLLSKNN